jgi:hypothetical protein
MSIPAFAGETMKTQLLNIRARQVICNCDAHCGDLVEQIDAQLPDGRPIAILKDWRGFHVAIGARNAIGEWQYTPPVSEEEVEALIRKAMQP